MRPVGREDEGKGESANESSDATDGKGKGRREERTNDETVLWFGSRVGHLEEKRERVRSVESMSEGREGGLTWSH